MMLSLNQNVKMLKTAMT